MSAPSNAIICCGFTPCIQRILEFPSLKKGGVNRACGVTLGIGGKGANTARVVQQLGGHPLLLGFAGGPNGRLLEAMLTAEGIPFRHVGVAGETRICQTLLEKDNPEATELVEEMPVLEAGDWTRMIALLDTLDVTRPMVCMSGRLPAGAPVDAYAHICRIALKKGGRAIVDTSGEPLLRTLEHRPYMVKINEQELRATVGGEDLIDSCLQLIGRGAQSVLVTRGARTGYYVDASQTLALAPPAIRAVNPIGSGDAVTAGIAVASARGMALQEVLAYGMACGAANALHLISGCICVGDVDRLVPEVEITA